MFLFFKASQTKKKMNEILENKVEQRTKELSSLNKKLSMSNKELEKFAFITSHDLKEPLGSIVSFTGLLKKEIDDNKIVKAEEYIDFIEKGGIQMKDLIEEILDYSTLNVRPIEKSTVDTNLVVSDAIKLFTKFIHDRNGELSIKNKLPVLIYDKKRIMMMFQNLIENGIKYND